MRGLSVKPEVLGAYHNFPFQTHTIRIDLPGLNAIDDDTKSYARVTTGSRRTSDGTPVEFDIHRVSVTVNFPQEVHIHPDSLVRPPVAYDLYEDREKEAFEKQCNAHRDIAEAAFQYWVSIFRWKLDGLRIGHSEKIGHDSGWGTYLHDVESRRPVWIERGIWIIKGHRVVNTEEWRAIEEQLQTSHRPPVYLNLRYDAEESIENRDYRKALIELAMACEIFIRQIVLSRIPNGVQQSLVLAIEELNINQFLTKHFRDLVPAEKQDQYRTLSKELSSLFAKRNKLLHIGDEDPATKDNCKRFLVVTKELHGLEPAIP